MLAFENISKQFPGVLALDRVSFQVAPGHCHAVIGENGAGKSTLGKILAGIHTADAGSISWDGRVIRPSTPLEARQLGIALVHQELSFCPNLTIAENLCLGQLPSRFGFLDRSTLRRRAAEMLSRIHAEIDLDRPLSTLSTGREQLVQIAAAVGSEARIIVMDEPTSSLTAHESEHLFSLIENLKKQGITILYVSHRMDEIFRLCNSVTVLRDGRHVATTSIGGTSPDRVVAQMVGRELEQYTFQHLQRPVGGKVLEVNSLSSPGKFSDVTFSISAGEILGFAGLVGAGRSEMAQAILGLDPVVQGEISVDGRRVQLRSPTASLSAGIGLVPEDRKRQGLVLSMTCRENGSLAALKKFTRAGFIRGKAESEVVGALAGRLRVKTPSLEIPVASLSGGNQQKMALIKWLVRECKLLIVDEPTRGVDVGAKGEIHHLLDELACQGMAIVLISSELPELLNLSRRLLVFRSGKVAAEIDRDHFSPQNVLRQMAGWESANN